MGQTQGERKELETRGVSGVWEALKGPHSHQDTHRRGGLEVTALMKGFLRGTFCFLLGLKSLSDGKHYIIPKGISLSVPE